uniref:Endo/exonuclease/phosphatase domain-containing protein n=1 Tax=Heligmosomoides polygyrus TaxID=6339 RepID=A0A183F4X6_HELPZ
LKQNVQSHLFIYHVQKDGSMKQHTRLMYKCDSCEKVVVAAEQRRYHLFSACAAQTSCSERAKDEFWSLLDEKTAEVPSQDVIIVAGDLNGHVGAAKDGYGCHGGLNFGSRNADGERILEYAESHDLTIVNTRFRKHKESSREEIKLAERMASILKDFEALQLEVDISNSWKWWKKTKIGIRKMN